MEFATYDNDVLPIFESRTVQLAESEVPAMGETPYCQLVFANDGRRTDLNKPKVLLGRRCQCDVTLVEVTVSAHHCLLWLAADGFWHIKDLDSRNGTFVNGVRITQKRLHPGDDVALGQRVRFRIEYPPNRTN